MNKQVNPTANPTSNVPKQYRQGDVFLRETGTIPAGCKAVEPEQGRVILARGELTGHHHSTPSGSTQLWEDEAGNRFLEVLEPAGLAHQEHAEIPLPIGVYRYTPQREYSPQEIRRVAD